MRTDSGYTTIQGTKLYYEILDDGFKLYEGESAKYPYIHQYEPYIPNPDLSYEENAIQMIKEFVEASKGTMHEETLLESRLTDIESNIDYLMLLNDPDSATE